MARKDAAKDKAYKHEWYMAHRDEIRQKKKRTNLENPEKVREQSHQSYMRHREKRLAKDKAYREAHSEGKAAYDRSYRLEHSEEIRLRKQATYMANLEENRRKKRESYQKNRENHLAYTRQWSKANPEQVRVIKRRYKRNNPEQGRIHASRRRARKYDLPDTFTRTERAFMLQYWHHACAVCGNQEGFFWRLADDHWDPIASPTCPGTVAENMIPLCDGQGGCNNSKHKREPQAWLLSRYTPSQTKRILKAIDTYFAVVRTRKESNAAD